MRDAFLKGLTELAESDPSVVLITADLGFGVFEDFERRFPKQYLNVGVAEQNMTGVATGMALEGRVVFTYSIGNFPTLRCLEQIRNDACYHDVNVNVVACGGGFSYGALGMSHHATEDLSIMRSLPNVTVVAPSDSWEMYNATKAITLQRGVGYLRIDKAETGILPQENEKFTVGKARLLRGGSDFTIVGVGGIVVEGIAAADELAKEGINVRVISMHTIKPLDKKMILSAARETGGVLSLEENNVIGGLAGAIAEVCLENGVQPKKFIPMGIQDTYSAIVGSQQFLRSQYGLNKEKIIQNIKAIL